MFNNTTTGFNFGQTPQPAAATNAPTFGTSSFGTPAPSNIFGSPPQQQQQQQPQQQSLFGTPQPQQQQQQTPSFGLNFGNTSTSAFGAGSAFSQPAATNQQPSSGFFGSATSTANTTGFGFGTPQQQQQQPQLGSSIMAPTAAQTSQPSLFGQTPSTSLSTGNFFAAKPTVATTTTASTGFGNFGSSGFNLNFGTTSAPNAATSAQPVQQSSLFGQTLSTPSFGGFGSPATANTISVAPTGITPAATTTTNTGFLSSATVPSFGSLSMPTVTTSNVQVTTTAAPSSFNLGAGFSSTITAPTFATSTFGQPTTAPATGPSLQFGASPLTTASTTTATTGVSSSVSQQAPSTITTTPAVTSTATTTTALPSFNFGTPQTSSTTTTTEVKPVFGAPTTSITTTLQSAPTTTSMSFVATTAPSIQQPSITQGSTSVLSSSLKPNTGFIVSNLGSTTSQTTTTTATTTTTTTTASTNASGSVVPQITFGQLEDQINIWTNELSQLEADFHSQSQTINSWDSLLVANGQKLMEMSKIVDKLKFAHRGIDHQLDFIIAQQKELEQLLEQVEQDNKLEFGSTNLNAEREYTYSLVETVHNDLSAIGSDLKDFIKKLNEIKSNQDSNDPMTQILKILNSHMDVLQWIENQIKNVKVN